MRRYITALLICLSSSIGFCATYSSGKNPIYVAPEQDLGKYYLYASGSGDNNWYVGFNNCWIVKLPPIPKGRFVKAYLGAKLGGAKAAPNPKKPWEFIPFRGKIFAGLSPNPGFSSQESYLLAENKDIPYDPSIKTSLPEQDSAKWFWVEVPLSALSKTSSNYAAIWADAEEFTDSAVSPIISAARISSDKVNVWVNKSIKGAPPRNGKTSLEIPVKGLAPAIAIKLVSANTRKVVIEDFNASLKDGDLSVSFSCSGKDVRAGWTEISYDKYHWQRTTSYNFFPPYAFNVSRENLPESLYYLRACALDSLENIGCGKILKVQRVEKK